MAFLLFKMTKAGGEINFFSRRVYIACWPIPIILTFLPLSTMTFGNLHDDHGFCFLDLEDGSNDRVTAVLWILVSFYVWMFIAAFIYFILFCYISYRFYNYKSEFADLMYKAILRLSWYPIIIFVCWTFTTFDDLYSVQHEDGEKSKFEVWQIKILHVFPISFIVL